MGQLSQFDRFVTAYARWIIRNRWMVLALSLVAFLAMASGLRHFVFNDNYRVFFDKDNPELVAYDRILDTFSRDDSVYFVVTAKSGNVFDTDALLAIDELTEQSWLLPNAYRVDSITNYQHSAADGDDLYVGELLPDIAAASAEERERARQIALDEPLLVDRLVNRKANVAGVNVTVQLPGERPLESVPVVEAARALRDEIVARHPSVEIGITGILPLNHAFLEATNKDMQTLIPIMMLLIVGTMVWLLRSFRLMLCTMSVVIISCLSAVGLASHAGVQMSGPSSPAPVMILTLAVADCIHLLMSMIYFMRHGHSKRAALVESMRVNFTPISLTSLTTIIGFLSMNLRSVPPVATLGNVTALGVGLAWIFAITFLPALIAVIPLKASHARETSRVRNAMLAVGEWVIRHRLPVCIVSSIVTLVLGSFVLRIEINNQFVDWFDDSIPIRRDTDYAMEQLTGIYQLTYVFNAGEPGGVSDPAFLARLDEFCNWVTTLPEVSHASSVADIFKRLNKSMHGDDPAYYRLPEDKEMAAQFLLLYEMSLPPRLDLTSQINLDKSETRVIVTVDNLRSEEILRVMDVIDGWQREHLPEVMRSNAYGPPVMFAHIAQTMTGNMLVSSPVALLTVSLTLILALRSLKLGLLSIIPNLMPLALGFGVWGLMGWDMNFSMTGIMAMGLGIVVDDTVHFMSKYLRARRVHRLSGEDAVRYAYGSVGKAMWVTSFVLVGGFLVNTLSTFQFSFNMGFLTAMVITFALAGDLLYLPTLLLYTDNGPGERSIAELEEDEERLLNEEEQHAAMV